MANVIINDTNLTNIAKAIRNKNGKSTKYKPSQMAAAINAIETGGRGEIACVEFDNSSVTSYYNTFDLSNWISNKSQIVAISGVWGRTASPTAKDTHYSSTVIFHENAYNANYDDYAACSMSALNSLDSVKGLSPFDSKISVKVSNDLKLTCCFEHQVISSHAFLPKAMYYYV
jgi:hypothetical protein